MSKNLKKRRLRKCNVAKNNYSVYMHDTTTIIFQVGNHKTSNRSRGSRSRGR
ncbi:hypothetical protein [Veillonella sp.]|uniref:hypothetical protein n=1 Tax=Veillonella sp. TaxID=1926307 RepID=UPI0025E73B39|nr:hypothetical protein [Veillonella sp.]